MVRAERLPDPSEFIPAILDRIKPEHIRKQYGIYEWSDALDFLTKLANKHGKLLRGGEPDLTTISVNMINDWQRGRLPYFVPPPDREDYIPTEEVTLATFIQCFYFLCIMGVSLDGGEHNRDRPRVDTDTISAP